MIERILLLVGVVALIGWFLFGAGDGDGADVSPTVSPTWIVHADQPLLIGGYGDNYAYTGDGVRPIEGSLDLRLDLPQTDGTITVSLETTEESGLLRVSSSVALSGTIRLVSRLDPSDRVEEGIPVYGDTGNGGPELPRTLATLAGWSRFDLYVNDELRYSGLSGEWAVAQALRRGDGAIRQSGLVYSPLLRNKTGFSDPNESEFTLILHSEAPDPENNPPYDLALHLVFKQVTIEKSPSKETASDE
jgi:hypothetical protein